MKPRGEILAGARMRGFGLILSFGAHALLLTGLWRTVIVPAGHEPAATVVPVAIVAAPAAPARPSEPAAPSVPPTRIAPKAGASPKPKAVEAAPEREAALVAPAAAAESAVVSLPDAPPSDPAPTDDSMQLYARTVWTRILDHKPRFIRLRGTVTLSFVLSRDGALTASSIAGSSGSDVLDQIALTALRAAAPFPPPPASATAYQLTFTIPFEFR